MQRRGVVEALGAWGREGRDDVRGRIARGGAWARAAGRRTAAAVRAACWRVVTLPVVAAAGGWRMWLRLLNRVARELVRIVWYLYASVECRWSVGELSRADWFHGGGFRRFTLCRQRECCKSVAESAAPHSRIKLK